MIADPIIVADSGPLIRLAAAGLLDSIRLTNRLVVLVDRIEEEICADAGKPFAPEVAAWIERMGDAIRHEKTVEGAGIAALRAQAASDEDRQNLKRKLRNSGERAIREYIESFGPEDVDSALILYEDSAVPGLMAAATVPMTLMTTRAFVRMITERGYNADAVQALEAIASQFSLKPVISTAMEGNARNDDPGVDFGKSPKP